MRIFRYISILLSIFLIGFCIYRTSPHYQIIRGQIFGTYYSIKIRTDNKNNELKEQIEARLQEINSRMSVFESESEISKINQTLAGKSQKLSPDMQQIMRATAEVYRQTDGWFDPTLGKLIDLWGFGASQNQTPSDAQIAAALRSVGFSKLRFNKDFTVLRKPRKDIFMNLSAIAKGYGVDAIAKLLDEAGYQDYVVEIGGEVKTKGYRSPSGEAWNIGINKPVTESTENALVLSLSNTAVATSGNYRNFYQKEGQIYGHTLSYKTGRPVLSDALSVTVFHDSCMYADAYATAIMAMGLEKGLAFADKYKLKVIIFDKDFNPWLSHTAQTIFGENDWKI